MKPPLETSLAYKYFVAYRLYDGQRFDEVVIPYRPKHSYQKKIKAALTRERRISVPLSLICLLSVCAAVAFTFISGHQELPVPVFLLIAAAALGWAGMEMYDGLQPTHFGLSKKGLRLYWIRWFGDNSSEYMPWDTISHVRLRKSKDAGLIPESWIDFVNTASTAAFSLRLDGIMTGEQRKRLHTAMKQFLSPSQIDPQLHDMLNPVKVDGYTQLWLEVLSTTPNRIRQDALATNITIANDRYEILGQIGSGGQGTAYLGKARAGTLGPDAPPLDVVLKEFVLPYNGGLHVSKKALENIEREAHLLKLLMHPQIVRMVDLFVEDQRAYLVLEHIDGETLRHLVGEHGPYDEGQVIALGLQMCEILSHLHGQNPPVVHRDFTPENMIMATDGQLKLIDFNVAQVMKADATRTVVGKHSYIPPEQFRGKASPQSDIYAMGASFYFLLTGKQPEPITTAHPRKECPHLSPEIDAIIAQCTAVDVDLRYRTADDVRDALLKLRARVASH